MTSTSLLSEPLPPPPAARKRKSPGTESISRKATTKRNKGNSRAKRGDENAPYRASSGRLSPTLLSPVEPIYRASRSRSGSSFALDGEEEDYDDVGERELWTDEDGVPGDDLLSAELIVKESMKTYKACEWQYSEICSR